jgi:hypothetical protein
MNMLSKDKEVSKKGKKAPKKGKKSKLNSEGIRMGAKIDG